MTGQAARAYITNAGDGMKNIKKGNVVEEFKLGNTTVKICDDYCRNRLDVDVEAILNRIARRAQVQLSAQA